MALIVASQSARRQELLRGLGVAFEVCAADVDETVPDGLPPDEWVMGLASRKLFAVCGRCGENDIIIAADTVVYCRGEVFGKPRDAADAYRMLRAMSGDWHEVYTGLAVGGGGRLAVEYERTAVKFRPLDDAEIWYYIEKEQPFDKAGAYGIQELAGLFVERIEGDYFNIVGLPVCRLAVMLRRELQTDIFSLMQP